MSISEKLITIAENQQKVFDAGRNSGGGGSYDEGYNNGYSDGYDSGYYQGLDSGYSEGQQSEYDRFWDNFQDYGNRTNYTHAFAGLGWTDETFKPKHTIRVVGWLERMFYNCNIKELILSGVTDFSAATDCRYMFTDAMTESIDVVDLSNIAEIRDPFYYVPNLHTIGKVKLADDGNQTFSPDWMYTTKLVNLTIEGKFGNDVSFWTCSRLSRESIESIISALSTSVSGKTLTLKQVAVTNAFGSTTASAWTSLVNSRSNWTISLV